MLFRSILLTIIGITQTYLIVKGRTSGVKISSYFVIVPVLIAFLGLLIMINPFSFANVVVVVLFGISSLIYGVTNVIRYFIIQSRQSKSL